MRDLPIERLTPEELHALDTAANVAALYDIAAELTALGRLARETRLHVTACKKDVRRNRTDTEAGCRLLDAQATFDNIRDRVRSLKDLKQTLQTILRSGAG
jgi:hypothetical protein